MSWLLVLVVTFGGPMGGYSMETTIQETWRAFPTKEKCESFGQTRSRRLELILRFQTGVLGDIQTNYSCESEV